MILPVRFFFRPTPGKCAVIKTSTRQTYFLPVIGLVDPEEMKPADLVGVNKDSYLILEKLPAEYDSRVKAMEVDARPTEEYNDIGGLDKQIQELIEAVVLPMTHKEKFENIGIHPPKGVLLYGPPGTSWSTCRSPRQLLRGRRFIFRILMNLRHREDFDGESLRRPDQVHLPEAGRPPVGPDVHRGRRQTGQGRVRPG